MREKFPRYEKGDRIHATTTNLWSTVCERMARFMPGSFTNFRHGSSFISQTNRPPFTQVILKITDTKINDDDTDESGFFLGQIRWYSTEEEKWMPEDDDQKKYEIDASSLRTKLHVGDKVTAYWDIQRGMFLPICRARPLVDLEGTWSTPVAVTAFGTGGQDIDFCLEISANEGAWRLCNDRYYTINAFLGEAHEKVCRVSGTIFYTFRAKENDRVRVRFRTNIESVNVVLDEASLRLEAKDDEAISHSLGTAFSSSSGVPGWSSEAETNIDDEEDDDLLWPTFVVQDGGTVKIRTPAADEGDDPENEYWTIKVELTCSFVLEPQSSSSSTSQSSLSSSSGTSSTSQTSVSSQSSLSATSVSSLSSSSSTSSTSSTSPSSVSSASSVSSSSSSSSPTSTSSVTAETTSLSSSSLSTVTSTSSSTSSSRSETSSSSSSVSATSSSSSISATSESSPSSASSSTSESPSSCMTSFPEAISQITGYNHSKTQVLTHVRGCLQWMDVEECP